MCARVDDVRGRVGSAGHCSATPQPGRGPFCSGDCGRWHGASDGE